MATDEVEIARSNSAVAAPAMDPPSMAMATDEEVYFELHTKEGSHNFWRFENV
jgi:hypothetical protein